MRRGLFLVTVIGSAVAAVATEAILTRLLHQVDGSLAMLACAWAGLPYILAALLAYVRRTRTAQLAAVLVALALSAFVGLSLFGNALVMTEKSDRDVSHAVLPGEDPSHGPAAMRKTGADAGQAIGRVVSAGLIALVPLAQLLVIAVASIAGYIVSAVTRRSPSSSAAVRSEVELHDPAGGETGQAAVL